MRILIVIPRQPPETGNRTTAERHRQGLEERGQTVRIVETAPGEAAGLLEAAADFRPDLVHLLHAFRSGAPWLAAPAAAQIPWVVTLTGTDLHQGLAHPAEGPVIRRVLGQAAAVVTQNRLTFRELQVSPAGFASRLHYLPPGVVLGTEPHPLRERLEIPADAVLFLHPAGVRPVKRNLELLQLFDPLAQRDRQLRVAFCGPVLDTAYAGRFQAALAARPWAAWAGPLPPAVMADVLRQAEVILNHSDSEGLPNALLEAAAVGRPILARAIPGNAAVVEAGVNGLLYRDEEEFTRFARTLLESPDLRRRLSAPRPELYDPDRETGELLAIYQKARAKTTSAGLVAGST